MEKNTQSDISDPRGRKNAGVIDHEANELLNFIEKQNLYRKGLYLYDTEKTRPVYSIVELSWAFCTYPSFAYQVSERLQELLQDLENPDEMSISDIEEWVNDFFPLMYEEIKKNQRGKYLCRFMHFFCTRKVMSHFDSYAIESKLEGLQLKGWEPATYFLKKCDRYSKCLK